jgi:phospholipid/cholesterol/gamma-HCH transport system ATP-binding protein
MPTEREMIVELEGVTAPAGERYATGLTDATLCLASGEAAIVTVRRTGLSTPVADLCCGLENPGTGVVSFLGRRWDERGHGEAARDRGRIGRVWSDSAWVGNLDIDENILLPQLHHTYRTAAELREQAMTLARAFGLDDLPHTRPAWTPEITRRKSQWVRAMMGTPDLLLLEYPDDDTDEADRDRLTEAVDQARTRGAAVIWITARQSPALTDLPGTVYRAELIGTVLTWRPKEDRMLKPKEG